MRQSLWIIALLFAAIAAPGAQADLTQYTINFTGADAPTVVGGTVDYNTTTDSFLPFTLSWNALTLTDDPLFHSGPLSPTTDSFVWQCGVVTEYCAIYDYSVGYVFLANVDGPCVEVEDCGSGETDTIGPYPLTFTAVTPEPGTAILWLTGIGLMIVTRKRIAHLLRLDTGTPRSLSPY